MQRNFSRRDFLALCSGASLAALPIFLPKAFLSNFNQTSAKKVCLQPIGNNSPSFIRFCEQKRFASAQEAIKAVQDPQATFELVYES